ncbi:MAG TPA: patatin-like phospholipase family protein [Baekduia sp.]
MHPVLELLRGRAAAGARGDDDRADDGARLALVLEGGGMRGVVSSAMADALEARGLLPCFDLVVGTSAGALNGAAFLAGVALGCTDNYLDADLVKRYIAPRRLLIGRAAVDVAFTLDRSNEGLDADRHRRTAASDRLHCVAIDVATARAEVLSDLTSEAELRGALLATSRLPWLGGDPVAFRGRRWLDGGLVDPIPVDAALNLGATHALVLQTRPEGVSRTPAGGLVERLIERRLRALNPDLVPLARDRFAVYENVVDRIASNTTNMLGVRLAAGVEPVSQLERRPAPLQAAAVAARARVAELFDS